MTEAEEPKPASRGRRIWPLSVINDHDHSKLRAYARAGVKEVWLVLGEKQIEVYRQPKGEAFTEHSIHGPNGRLTSAVVPGFAVELDTIFAS